MKGVVLAGGLGTRLAPLTLLTNKHLLPVYDRPMVCYALASLVEAGLEDVMLVTGGPFAGDFLRFLGDGRRFGLRTLSYTYQEREGGIAEAIGLCETWAEGDSIVVVLGDNVFDTSLAPIVGAYRNALEASGGVGAHAALTEVADPRAYGVAVLEGTPERIARTVEKPADPPTNLAVMGLYGFDARVYEHIRRLRPSARNEWEVTDLLNLYAGEGRLTHSRYAGWWADAGESIDAYSDVIAQVVRRRRAHRDAHHDAPLAPWDVPPR